MNCLIEKSHCVHHASRRLLSHHLQDIPVRCFNDDQWLEDFVPGRTRKTPNATPDGQVQSTSLCAWDPPTPTLGALGLNGLKLSVSGEHMNIITYSVPPFPALLPLRPCQIAFPVVYKARSVSRPLVPALRLRKL